MTAVEKRQVPKILHRILVCGYDPGDESHRWWGEFAAMHPGWETKTWTDPITPGEWELGRLFASCGSGAQLADLLRIEILWRHGGIYVDSDVEPLRPLDSLLVLGAFVGTEDGRHISSGVIGATAHHPAIRALMDRLLRYSELPPDLPPNETTGPHLFTRVLATRTDVVVLPRTVFYPVGPLRFNVSEADQEQDLRRAYTTHHWEASWLPEEAPAPMWTQLSRKARAVSRSAGGRLKSEVLRKSSRAIHRLWADQSAPISDASPHGLWLGEDRVLVNSVFGSAVIVPTEPQDAEVLSLIHTGGNNHQAAVGVLNQLLRPGDWCIDVTAGAGLLTMAAAQRVDRWGRVFAVHRDARLGALVTASSTINGFASVDVVRTAVGLSLPRTIPIRLVITSGRDGTTDEVANLIGIHPVDYVLITDGIGSFRRWGEAVELARILTRDHGAGAAVLDGDGILSPISLDALEDRTQPAPIIIDLTGPITSN